MRQPPLTVRPAVRSAVRSATRTLLSLLDEATAELGLAPYHYWDFTRNRALIAGADVGAVTASPGWTASAALVMDANGLSVTTETISATLSGVSYPCTIFVEANRIVDAGATQTIMQIDNNSNAERVTLIVTSADLINGQTIVASASNASPSPAVSSVIGTTFKAAIRAELNNVNAAANGTLGTNDTIATMPAAPTHIRFGSNASGITKAQSYIRRAAIFTSALSNAELQAVTA